MAVTAANSDDRQGIKAVLGRYFADGIQRLQKIWADGNYSGHILQRWAARLKKTHKVTLERAEKAGPGFHRVKHR